MGKKTNLKKHKESLLSGLCLCGKEALLKYFKAATERELTPGIIAVIQSFGSRINLHPHLHFLVTEGGVAKDGRFHPLESFNDALLCQFFTREVFSLLLHHELVSLSLVEKILRWRQTDFNLYSKVKATSKFSFFHNILCEYTLFLDFFMFDYKISL